MIIKHLSMKAHEYMANPEYIDCLLGDFAEVSQQLEKQGKEIEQLKEQVDGLASANFKQATKINDITGRGYAFHNDLTTLLGGDVLDDNFSVRESIVELKEQLKVAEENARKFYHADGTFSLMLTVEGAVQARKNAARTIKIAKDALNNAANDAHDIYQYAASAQVRNDVWEIKLKTEQALKQIGEKP